MGDVATRACLFIEFKLNLKRTRAPHEMTNESLGPIQRNTTVTNSESSNKHVLPKIKVITIKDSCLQLLALTLSESR